MLPSLPGRLPTHLCICMTGEPCQQWRCWLALDESRARLCCAAPAGAASLERCPDTIRFLQTLAALGSYGPSAEEAAAELPEMQAARGLFQWQVGSVSDGSNTAYKPS